VDMKTRGKDAEAHGELDFSVNLAGMHFTNPLVAASGVFGYGEEYARVGEIRDFGAVAVKGTTLKPRAGNAPPRTCETACGILNSIGLENPGAKIVVKEKIPWLKKYEVPVIVNISANSYDEFSELASVFSDVQGVDAL